MKIVIQQGDLVNKDDTIGIFKLLPARCETKIDTVVVYGAVRPEFGIEYHTKARQLSIYCPPNTDITKSDALKVIGVGLLAISKHGDVQSRLKKSLTKDLEIQWEQLL